MIYTADPNIYTIYTKPGRWTLQRAQDQVVRPAG